jgi:hypothetical protein
MVMGALIRLTALPADYRWATALEAELWDTLPDAIQIIVGNDAEVGPYHPDNKCMTDIAVPAAYPAMFDILDNGRVIDCLNIRTEHSSHKTCPDFLMAMSDGDFDFK